MREALYTRQYPNHPDNRPRLQPEYKEYMVNNFNLDPNTRYYYPWDKNVDGVFEFENYLPRALSQWTDRFQFGSNADGRDLLNKNHQEWLKLFQPLATTSKDLDLMTPEQVQGSLNALREELFDRYAGDLIKGYPKTIKDAEKLIDQIPDEVILDKYNSILNSRFKPAMESVSSSQLPYLTTEGRAQMSKALKDYLKYLPAVAGAAAVGGAALQNNGVTGMTPETSYYYYPEE